jgi:hypothetical protein
MGLIGAWNYDLTNTETADADEVMSDLDQIKTEVNNIELANMAASSVDTSQLVADAVETAKIADLNVTTEKLEADAITEDKLEHTVGSSPVRVLRYDGGDTSGTGTEGLKIIRCETDVDTTGGAVASVTVDFSAESLEGSPGDFSDATTIICVGLVYGVATTDTEADVPNKMWVDSAGIAVNQAVVYFNFDGVPNVNAKLYSTWIGPTAA